MDELLRGRGAQLKLNNRFSKQTYSDDYFDFTLSDSNRTAYTEVFPKTILNKILQADMPMDYSMNPYQGCEHGCIYCYARTTHEYWGYGAGLDFERKIMVKKTAPDLLRKAFMAKKWKAASIMLSGNTDCYQPMERELGITRRLLEVFNEFGNPVGILTKNSLIERDLDLLQQLNERQLVKVSMSVTTLNDELRRKMEPRTSSAARKLKTIERLKKAGIPISIIIGPVIPGLNLDEIPDIIRETAKAGAEGAGYTNVRLNGPIAPLFEDWLEHNFPDRKDKVLNQIREVNKGVLGLEQGSGVPNTGGEIHSLIHQLFELNKKKYIKPVDRPFNYKAFSRPGQQISLDFD